LAELTSKASDKSAKTSRIHSGGIKPLNAPRVIYVRTDSTGSPTAVQVPPAINSPGARRRRRQSSNPHPSPPLAPGVHSHLVAGASSAGHTKTRERGQDHQQTERPGSPSQIGRELEGGSAATRPATTKQASALRRNTTPAENLLWQHLRKTQVPKYKFTRQYPIGPYIVDFCCRTACLVIELDGGGHATQQEADIARQQDLEDHGYRVIRFWNNEVFENTEGVLFRIVEELERRSLTSNPHPSPSSAPGVHSHLVAHRNDPHPSPLPSREREQNRQTVRTGSSSQIGRELEGGSKRTPKSTTRPNQPTASDSSVKVPSAPLVSDGAWMRIVEIENLWKVNDEWWRGSEEEIARLYYVLRFQNGQQLTVYLDLTTNNWYRQAG